MKRKVADLEGALLDAAVAKALGHSWRIDDETVVYVRGRLHDPEEESAFCPSMYWDHGGPIIYRERIAFMGDDSTGWCAAWQTSSDAEGVPDGFRRVAGECWQEGSTPLIAAMRAFVAKLGDEVEL